MLLNYILGSNIEAISIVAILELILACYSIALMFNAQNKILKIIWIVSTVLWVVLGVLNIIG